MKRSIIALTLIVSLIAACSQKDAEVNIVPDSLDAKKKLLVQKKQDLRELQTFIDELQSSIVAQDPSQRDPGILVTTDTLMRRKLTSYVDVQGTVVAEDFANASSETGGRLTKVIGDEGQYVRAGALIATVDLQSINKQISEITTALSLAEQTYERQKRLWDQNIGSEIQYLQAKNQVERLQKSKETLEHQLTKANVYAPISGDIDMVFKEAGEFAAPGEPIVRIMNTARLKTEIQVPENYLRSINRGDIVQVSIPALEKEMEAKVVLIGNTINPTSRTFKVETSLNNRDGLLKPNLLAVMKLAHETVDDAIVLPADLIQQEVSGKDYVFIVDKEKDEPRALKRYVETGLSYDGQIEIKSGLEGSEEIIRKGALGLNNGDLINVVKQEG